MYSCHLFLISSASVRSIPFLSFIVLIFARNVPFVSLIFLKRSLVIPILLSSSIYLHWVQIQYSENYHHDIWSHHFMANRWGNIGNSERLYFGRSKIATDGDCSHEIKRCLLLERKIMTNLDSILKSRDITMLTKVHLIKAMVFPLVMYGCESWTIKKAESRRIDAFEL